MDIEWDNDSMASLSDTLRLRAACYVIQPDGPDQHAWLHSQAGQAPSLLAGEGAGAQHERQLAERHADGLAQGAGQPRPALSAQVRHVQVLQLRLGCVLEEGGAVLAFALLHPVAVDTEGATVDDLEIILHY